MNDYVGLNVRESDLAFLVSAPPAAARALLPHVPFRERAMAREPDASDPAAWQQKMVSLLAKATAKDPHPTPYKEAEHCNGVVMGMLWGLTLTAGRVSLEHFCKGGIDLSKLGLIAGMPRSLRAALLPILPTLRHASVQAAADVYEENCVQAKRRVNKLIRMMLEAIRRAEGLPALVPWGCQHDWQLDA